MKMRIIKIIKKGRKRKRKRKGKGLTSTRYHHSYHPPRLHLKDICLHYAKTDANDEQSWLSKLNENFHGMQLCATLSCRSRIPGDEGLAC